MVHILKHAKRDITSIFVQATAGLRTLGVDASEKILQAVNVASYSIFSS